MPAKRCLATLCKTKSHSHAHTALGKTRSTNQMIEYIGIVIIAIAGAYLIWVLSRAANATCEIRDIIKKLMQDYETNNDVSKV